MNMQRPRPGAPLPTGTAAAALARLQELERKVLWLSCWMIHHANHVRPSRDGLKVGGHQASCASAVTLLTALYLHVLRPEDRVAVKPHAAPVFHAIQYLLGNQGREPLEAFRAFGGAQPYPSRTKDADDVDFSTGSVGLGVATTLFGSIVQDYVRLHGLVAEGTPAGIVTLTPWLRHGRCFSVSECARYLTVVTAFRRSSSSMPSGCIAVSR